MGAHLNSIQLAELCGSVGHRVYLCLDADYNHSGQRAASSLSRRLRKAGVEAMRVPLPWGEDPNSFLSAPGAEASDFQQLLDRARP